MSGRIELGRMLSAACGEKFREMGCSMEAVAAGANISVTSVVNALKDGTTTRSETWVKLCGTLDVDYEEIVRKHQKMVEKRAEATLATVEQDGNANEAAENGPEGVLVHADPVELYRLFLFCEERMADNLRMGTRMTPEELYRIMQAMYAMRDAALALQPGEVVTPETPSVT